jgi:hypothetical protein
MLTSSNDDAAAATTQLKDMLLAWRARSTHPPFCSSVLKCVVGRGKKKTTKRRNAHE